MNWEAVAAKLAEVAKKVEADGGSLELFGLFLREGSPNLWDVVVSAPRLQARDRASFEVVAKRLRELLSEEEQAGLSRVVILEHGGAVLAGFLDHFGGKAGLVDVAFSLSQGPLIRQAYIVKAARPGPPQRRTVRHQPRTTAATPPASLRPAKPSP